jgi:tetratricopeptide (TPR) repeat protein
MKPPNRVPEEKALSPGRKWLFRLLAAVVLPLLFLAVVEVALRLGGYGYDTHFFKSLRIGDRDVLVENDSFGYRFFPAEEARLPLPIMMAARKPADIFRIFVFGGSAAEGDPNPAFGPARFMEILLRERFPQQHFEVVNVAITAIDSHGILPIARECARQNGDLWIIYMGNNEMIGPFGAAGVFGRQAPPLPVIRASLALQETRLGQLLKAGSDRLTMRSGSASQWGGLEMFAASRISPLDPAKERVYQNFRGNLDDILRAGLGSGAKLVLNTVAVNLKDCAPLASEIFADLTPAAKRHLDQLSGLAKGAEDKGEIVAAEKYLQEATTLAPHCADLQYRWGQCLWQMTNYVAARTHFQLACDNDAIPARTDSRINDIIRQSVQQFSSGRLVLCDAPAILATNTVGGICGGETFYEHVHFNPNGSYRLGRAWADQVAACLPAEVTNASAGVWASQELCERRLAMTDWSRRNDWGEIVKRRQVPPLSGQADNARQLASLQTMLTGLGQRMDAADVAQARQICGEAIARAPQDLDLVCNYGDFLESIGSASEAAQQWRQVQRLRPVYYLGYFQEGRMQEFLGDLDAAKGDFLQTVALRPAMAPAWYELGNIAASQGDLAGALRDVEQASRLQPHLPVYYACLGKLLARMNRHPEAVERFQEALRVDDKYVDGHLSLGREFAATGNWSGAQTEFQAAVQLQPDSVPAHLALGGALASQGQMAAAQREFQEVLQRDPGNQQAQAALHQIQ